MPNREIEALLQSPDPGWNRINGEPGTVIYSFADDPNRGFGITVPNGEWAPFSGEQKAGIRLALAAWADASGLAFVEVPDTLYFGDINIRFHLEVLDGGDGFSGYPGTGGDVYLNLGTLGGSSFAPGTQGFRVAIHEIGHAIGLKHPFEGSVQLPAGQLTAVNTVLSYDSSSVTGLGTFDLDAVRYIYGENSALSGAAVTRLWDAARGVVRHTGSVADERVFGTSENDVIDGGAGNDFLRGGIGMDEYVYYAEGYGRDSMFGGAGDDTIESAFASAEVDTIDGGAGFDWLTIRSITETFDGPIGAHVSLSAGTVLRQSGSGARTDYISSIEGVLGTDNNDTISGYPSSSAGLTFRLAGGRGNDWIYGSGQMVNQADYSSSGNGIIADLVSGRVLDGFGGSDQLFDLRNIAGSAVGADSILSSVAAVIFGQGGNDTLRGGGGSTLDGGAGNDMLIGSGLSNTLNGGSGDDVVLVGDVTLAGILALFAT
jgi:Ca2+-binding RTX toxin-like protein